ncbi:MAG: hypothetical protein BVN35_17815 [Proteobacteria bacterium ST_bin11]|nr:MAG: hypothetical protein BVN35_17815 [Proteobacteria bacterium ST_bin11]
MFAIKVTFVGQAEEAVIELKFAMVVQKSALTIATTVATTSVDRQSTTATSTNSARVTMSPARSIISDPTAILAPMEISATATKNAVQVVARQQLSSETVRDPARAFSILAMKWRKSACMLAILT